MGLLFDALTATAYELQTGLRNGKFDSVYLIFAYLSQIEKYDDYLHAVLSVAPRASLIEQAKSLDAERKNGKTRGLLHGIPILIKVSGYYFPNFVPHFVMRAKEAYVSQ